MPAWWMGIDDGGWSWIRPALPSSKARQSSEDQTVPLTTLAEADAACSQEVTFSQTILCCVKRERRSVGRRSMVGGGRVVDVHPRDPWTG